MPNSRSIPPEAWGHAFQALVFYFSRRLGVENAEDLAQQTLMAVAQRDDFFFEKEEDFQRVCYGFAGNILKAAFRQNDRRPPVPLDASMPESEHRAAGPKAIECAIFLQEVLQVGEEQLKERDWKLIRDAAEAQMDNMPYSYRAGEANSLRVALHRARKKLARLTGWRDK